MKHFFAEAADHFAKMADHFGEKAEHFRDRSFSADHFAPIILVATKNRKSIILVDDHFGGTGLYLLREK